MHSLIVFFILNTYVDICQDDFDYIEECPMRAANGECDSNYSEMYRFCQKSCQMCGDGKFSVDPLVLLLHTDLAYMIWIK